MSIAMRDDARDLFTRATPILFVLIWSTGWISAGYAALYADPLAFLLVRHSLAALALAVLALMARSPWPTRPRLIVHAIVAGVLLNGLYLAGVWWAVRHGVPAGLSGVIAALQPIFTAALAPLILKETVTGRQWLGIALGFLGLCVAFAPRLAGLDGATLQAALIPIAINVAAMLAATLGTFYQKKYASGMDVMPVTALQFFGAAIITAPLAFLLEPMRVEWNFTIILTMAWSVIVLSIGGVCLLIYLIRRGAVSKVATLIYLVPPVTAAMAYVTLGETLNAVQIAGLALTVAGVWLATARS
ncbi:DMT family transporter [Terrarubrum flagellatum]|uniref:DMT family transporter n=1 Tax=Terrirubrum flagellatum TaxID=2895980 RepID=UPI0031451CAD